MIKFEDKKDGKFDFVLTDRDARIAQLGMLNNMLEIIEKQGYLSVITTSGLYFLNELFISESYRIKAELEE